MQECRWLMEARHQRTNYESYGNGATLMVISLSVSMSIFNQAEGMIENSLTDCLLTLTQCSLTLSCSGVWIASAEKE